MSDTLVAKRYARALFHLADEEGVLEGTDRDISLISDSLAASQELVSMFESPVISRSKKESITRKLFSERVGKTTLEFLGMLIGKRREDIFPSIVDAYRALRNDQLGIVEAEARVAKPMSGDEEQQLRSSLERLTGKRVKLNTHIDPALIGGVSVKIGDTVYDGSVRYQLEDLRRNFKENTISHSN